MNGERDGSPAENFAAAFRQASSPSQPLMQSSSSSLSQFQPESYRVNEQFFRFPSAYQRAEQTLESSFGRLSVFDSNVLQQHPLLDNRWSNRSSLHNQEINGGGYWSLPPTNAHREIATESLQQINHQLQRLSFKRDCVNGSSGYDPNVGEASSSQMFNNGFLNGNLRDVPYFSRYLFSDKSPWDSTNGYGSGINDSWRSNEGFVHNQDLENTRRSIVSLAKVRIFCNQLLEPIAGGSAETIDIIFNDVIFHICHLMVDPFVHHVVQKLMEKCSSEQITQILDLHSFYTITVELSSF